MRHRTLPMLLACGSLLAGLPAAAEVYTIRLTNGTTFESRYQPKQAAWDAGVLTFLDETGLEVALAKGLIAEVAPQSELKGFGKVINTTTVDLGFAPNDLEEFQARMRESNQNPFQESMTRTYDQQQFVEPDQVGGGIPVGFGGGGGTGFTSGTFVPPNVTLPPTSSPAPATPTTPTTPPTSPQQ